MAPNRFILTSQNSTRLQWIEEKDTNGGGSRDPPQQPHTIVDAAAQQASEVRVDGVVVDALHLPELLLLPLPQPLLRGPVLCGGVVRAFPTPATSFPDTKHNESKN